MKLLIGLLIAWTYLSSSALWADEKGGHAEQPRDFSHAWLLELPGISGFTGLDRGMIQGLRDGGYDGVIEAYDWPGKNPGIPALLASKRNHEEAQKIASRIEEHRRSDPHGQILIVTHSAGAGLCAWALEALPKDVCVNMVLFLAPALSPDYDLSGALLHVHGNAYAFTSPNDFLVLGAGTRVFGTVDGKKGTAAGLTGFAQPDSAMPDQYQKLISRPYQPEWLKYDNLGDHVGPMTHQFSKAMYSPLLMSCLPTGATAVSQATKPITIVIRPSTMPVMN